MGVANAEVPQPPLATNQPDHAEGSSDDDYVDNEEQGHDEEPGSCNSSSSTSVANGDWLVGRNDPIDFMSDQYVGEVFVLAAKDRPGVRQSLALRSRNWKNYSRWRVVMIEECDDGNGPADSEENKSKKVATPYEKLNFTLLIFSVITSVSCPPLCLL